MRGPLRATWGLVVLLMLGLTLSGLIVAVGLLAGNSLQERWRAERLSELAQLRARLEGSLSGVTNLTAGLIAEVAVRGGIDHDTFRRHARELMVERSLLRNITLAPDNVVRFVYPLPGNEASVGLDLLNHPVQGAATRMILASRRPVLAGPVELVQGGRALIHRVPIYLTPTGGAPRSGGYWGLMSTPVDFDGLLRVAGLEAAMPNFRLALRGVDGLGARGEVFWGDAVVFSLPDAFLLDVQVLDGSWQIAAQPTNPPALHRMLVWGSWALAGLLAVLTIAMAGSLQRAHRRLAESEQLHREMAEQLKDVLFRTDAEQFLSYLGPAWREISGQPAEAMLGRHWSSLLHPDDRARAAEGGAKFIAAGQGRYDEAFRLVDGEGRMREVMVRAALHRDSAGAVAGIVGVLMDVTERKRLQARLEVAARMFQRSGEAIVVFGPDGAVQSVNPAFETITGLRADEVVGRRVPLFDLEMSADRDDPWAGLQGEDYWQGERVGVRRDGSRYPLSLSLTAVREEGGSERGQLVAIFSDITERKAAEQRVQHMALHDGLTGLANRSLLASRFEQDAALARREGHAMALLYFDLDGFKPINDQHGHEVGDMMLRHVANRLLHEVRESDTVARVGGDEFVVLLGQVGGAEDAAAVAGKLLEALAVPLGLGQLRLQIGASVGIGLYPTHGHSLDELMRAADRSMYQVKSRGLGGWRLASDS